MTPNEQNIKLLVEGDLENIVALENEIFTSPWDIDSIQDVVQSKGYIKGIKSLDKENITGYAFYWIVAGEAHIASIAVRKIYRKNKIGSMLLNYIFDECAENYVDRVILEVRESNIAAIGLYSKYGFGKVGVRKNYYPDNSEDALIMVKQF